MLLGLGANLGDPVRQLREAMRRLATVITIDAVSSVYRSAPVGYRDQPDFHNLACGGRTLLGPEALLAATWAIEREMGRERSFPNAPRVMDIDLLAYDDRVIRSPVLVIPHPRLHERGFVLAPLAEIAPAWTHPVLGGTPLELMAAADGLEPIERVGPLAGEEGRGR